MSNFSSDNAERRVRVNERITIYESRRGQSFGADAFLLAAYARADAAHAAVDLGSGSGICSLLLADRNKAKKIYAVELQAELDALCRKNIADNGFSEKIKALHNDVRLITPNNFDEPVATVISNPPYFTAESGRQSPEPGKNAARFELNGTLYDFCAAAERILVPRGSFYCVIRPERISDLTGALRAADLEPSRMTFVHHNAASSPAMLLLEAVKGGRGRLNVTRPLFLYENGKEQTSDAKQIYENCDFGDLFQ